MHHSRLTALIIDCHDIEAGIAFWTGALGTEAVRGEDPDDPYVGLKAKAGSLSLILQRVPEGKTCKSRLHLDIETDDVEAEAVRLEGLGARRQEMIEGWWVMQDPNGNEFCVVPIQTDDFPEGATTWGQ
jgi:predicted enzyme related to lactoylglutathione lyase